MGEELRSEARTRYAELVEGLLPRRPGFAAAASIARRRLMRDMHTQVQQQTTKVMTKLPIISGNIAAGVRNERQRRREGGREREK